MGGGLTAAGRVRREALRLQAAAWFAQGIRAAGGGAAAAGVSPNSAYVWRRRWRAGGEVALGSKGPGGAVCRLSVAQLARVAGRAGGRPGRLGVG